MGLIQNIKNLFWKGSAAVGATKSLGNITDDPRIAIPANEYERIRLAKEYYRGNFGDVIFRNSYGDRRHRPLMGINVTKMAARRLASIIFNEQCKITIDGDDDAEALWESIAAAEDFYLTYEEKLEPSIALGGGAIRPYIADDQIKFAWVATDLFYPLNSNTSKVDEAAIASVTQRSEGNNTTVYYTLLEFHQWLDNGDYQISYELYRSTNKSEVGNQVPLNTLDEYADLQPQITFQGLKYPLFAYYKNPGANNRNLESPLGLGLVDNSIRTVDAINTVNDQFYWEVKMGKRRVAVPAEMLRKFPSGFGSQKAEQSHPAMFDADESVYQAMYGDDDMKITDLTSPIRTVDYQAAIDIYLHEFENQIGLSQGTFTTTPDGVQTATEVVSNNSMTYQTRSSYLTQVQKQITAMIRAVFELAKCGNLFSDGQPRWNGNVDDLQINIDFADGVFVDKDAQLKNDLSMVTANTLSKQTFLVRNLGMSTEQAQQELSLIKSETPEPATNAELGLYGGDDNGNDQSNADEGKPNS